MIEVGSLFDGISAFGLGFALAGMRCVWRSEIDRHCNALMDRRQPDIPNLGDVRNVTRRTARAVDLVCGGFPCQDVSVAGKRAGLAGERSGLWFEFHRVLAELAPRWVVIENVPGLLSSNGGQDFATVIYGLGELGYRYAWRVLDAQYFGVAQRRRRVFIVGHLGDGRAAQVLFESEGGCWDPPPSREAGTRVADPLTKCFAKHHGASAGKDSFPRNHVIAALTANGVGTCGADDNQAQAGHLIACSDVSRALTSCKTATGRFDPNGQEFVVAQCHGTNVGPMGELRRGNGHLTGGVPFVAFGVSENQRAELRLTEYSRQITSGGGKPGQGYPCVALPLRASAGAPMPDRDSGTNIVCANYGVRRLTPTECERLQGFPEIEKCVIIDVCVDHQKNFASVEIQNHKLPRPVGNVERTGLLELAKSVVPSSNTRNQPKKERAPLIVHINCGERTVDVHSPEKSLSFVNSAAKENQYPLPMPTDDFAHLLVGLTTIAEKTISSGREASQARELPLIHRQNGSLHAKLSGNVITQRVNDAKEDLITHRKLLKSIISDPSDTAHSESNLITSCSYVLAVISGYILPEILNANSFRIEIHTHLGWTSGQSDTQRYKQLGNAVAVPVAEWIGRRIVEADNAY